MTLSLDRDVLLYFEDRDRDTFVRGDRKYRRFLRKTVALLRTGRQRVSGFEMSFRLLRKALIQQGRRVHVNDYALARSNPDFPVGLCGYAQIIDHWSLPNPAVLGPGLFDHPKQRPALLHDERFRSYIVFCDWMRDLFSTVWDADALVPWFGGMDLGAWVDTRSLPKSIDVLVYDKIRWNRDTIVPALKAPIIAELERRGLSYAVVRYGKYTLKEYQKLLRSSRSMLFLCEHETQGMAYQEALASNLPVLAWDQGTWLDPNRPKWEDAPVPASSVPYFSSECGERFRSMTEFATVLDRFMSRLHSYHPRRWVEENLSLRQSAELYLRAYVGAAAIRERETMQAIIKAPEPAGAGVND